MCAIETMVMIEFGTALSLPPHFRQEIIKVVTLTIVRPMKFEEDLTYRTASINLTVFLVDRLLYAEKTIFPFRSSLLQKTHESIVEQSLIDDKEKSHSLSRRINDDEYLS
jgi:hypothetical protein